MSGVAGQTVVCVPPMSERGTRRRTLFVHFRMTNTPSLKESRTKCPSCGASSAGKFCGECGTSLRGGACVRCGTELGSGARFCEECGLAVNPGAATGRSGNRGLPTPAYLVGGLAAIALVVLVVVKLSSGGGTGAAISQAPLGAMSAPDISNMTPRERASRLYDRIMRLHEEQKAESVAFFAPMALTSYGEITDLDADGRYDMARIAMVAGAVPLANAQADTILRGDPNHLLGLILSADLARSGNDVTRARKFETAFVTSYAREMERKLPEYEAHGQEIQTALARMRDSTKR